MNLQSARTDSTGDALNQLKLQNFIPRPDTVDMQPRTQRYFSNNRGSFNPFETFNKTVVASGINTDSKASPLRSKSLARSTI